MLPNTEDKQDVKEGAAPEAHMIPKTRLDEVLAREKKEKERADALELRLNALETAKLAEANDYKALYERSQLELAEVKPVAATVDEAKKVLESVLAAQVAEIPEAHRGLIPAELPVQAQLNWIAKNKTLLLKPRPFDIGAGAGNNGEAGGNGSDLSEDEVAFAKSFGTKPADYSKFK